MNRSKTLLLALALMVGLGLTTGCNQKGKTDAKASAKTAKKDDTKKADKPADKKEASSGSELPFEATGTVAIVNGEKITADDFNKVVKQRSAMFGGRQMPPRLAKMMMKRTLDRLIDEKLIDKQLADAKITVDDKELNKEFDKFKGRFPSPDQFKSFLDRNHMTEAKMKENLGKDLQLRKLLEKKYGIAVTDKDAKDYYDANPKRFEQKEQVHARHILIKTSKDDDKAALAKAKKRAEAIAKEAKKPGTDFAKLAKEKSEGPSASRGGDLGFFTRKRMVPGFSKAAFAMKPGQISDPVKTQFGYHIIKVIEKKKAGTVPFKEAKDKILNQLKRQKFRQSMKKFLDELHKSAKIERKDDNIKMNVKAPKGGAGASPMGGMPPHMQLSPKMKQQLQQKLKAHQAASGKSASGKADPTKIKLTPPSLGK